MNFARARRRRGGHGAWVCVSLSLSHDSSGGPTRPDDRATRPGLDRSIGRSVGRVDRSIDRSVGRSVASIDRSIGRSVASIDRSIGRSVGRACRAPYIYIIINIPYQYIHHRLNPPRLTPQPYTGPRAPFASRHFIRRLVVVVVEFRRHSTDGDRRREGRRRRRSRSSSSSRASVERSSDDDDDDG